MNIKLTTEEKKELQEFNEKLNTVPDKSLIKKDDSGQYLFLPIDYIEDKLRELYHGFVQYEIKQWERLEDLREIATIVTVSVKHPVTGEWLKYDGAASAELISIFKSRSVDSEEINEQPIRKIITVFEDSLKLDLPLSYTLAVKNAVKHIGKAFGSELNRYFGDEGFKKEQPYKSESEEKKENQQAAAESYRNAKSANK